MGWGINYTSCFQYNQYNLVIGRLIHRIINNHLNSGMMHSEYLKLPYVAVFVFMQFLVSAGGTEPESEYKAIDD